MWGGPGRRKAFDSTVRRYHVYKDGWKPPNGEKLNLEKELDNAVNKFTVKVVKNNESANHLASTREFFFFFIARGVKICVEVTGRRCHCKQLCGGMEIPCRLVFSCLSKVKINRL